MLTLSLDVRSRYKFLKIIPVMFTIWVLGTDSLLKRPVRQNLTTQNRGGAVRSCRTRNMSGPRSAQTEAKVQEIVGRFQETNQTPGVAIAIWSPMGRFVSATGVADCRHWGAAERRHAVQNREPDQDVHR